MDRWRGEGGVWIGGEGKGVYVQVESSSRSGSKPISVAGNAKDRGMEGLEISKAVLCR